MTAKPDRSKPTPESQLRAFMAKLEPDVRKLYAAVRAALRRRFPTCHELVYDYASSLVIAYSPTDHGIDGIVTIAARAHGVRLYLANSPRLPDPKRLLRGSGKQARYVEIESARRLAHPDVVALVEAAVEHARIPPPAKGESALVVRSDAAKRLSRRRPAT